MLVEAQQLVRVAVLLVVVDQPRVGRRRDDAVERPAQVELARVAVEDLRDPVRRAYVRERRDPLERVERVAQQEAARGFHRPAGSAVLEAPVLVELRLAREVEVEVRRPPRRAGRAREHDPEHVRVSRPARRASGNGAAPRLRSERTSSGHRGSRPPGTRRPGFLTGVRRPRLARAPTTDPSAARRCCTAAS